MSDKLATFSATQTMVSTEFRGFADPEYLLNDQVTDNMNPTVVTNFLNVIADQNICSIIVITPGGVTNHVPAGDVVIEGSNTAGNPVVENVPLTENQSTPAFSAEAFCSITKITFPTQDGPNATYDLGLTADIQIKLPKLDLILYQVRVSYGGVPETSENFNVNILSDLGVEFDMPIVSDDQQGLEEFLKDFNFQYVSRGHTAEFSYANPDSVSWALVITWARFSPRK